jgi:hypothetical protein
MEPSKLVVDMLPQPDDCTCGPTCLHALYRFFSDELPLEQVIDEVDMLEGGGTLDVLLANHALRRGYTARIYTYNLHLFDPTWFVPDGPPLADRLRRQMEAKPAPKLRVATEAYLEFLERGGRVLFEDLTAGLIQRHLARNTPIITGLSATYLHRTPREYGDCFDPDDVRGVPAGHFVILYGYDPESREVLVADPLLRNQILGSHKYIVSIERVICAILLGIVTYDANLLIIEPPPGPAASSPAQKRE